MTRPMSATLEGGRATFLLEMALDRARLKQRLAAVLLAERGKRGGGDPRRFAQPAMAQLLGYSLRQYQRLEDPADTNLPSWNNLEAIADKLGLDASELFGDDEVSTATNGAPPDEAALRQMVEEVVAEALVQTNAMLRRLLDEEPPESQADGHGGL